MQQVVTNVEGLERFSQLGTIKKVYPLLDVVFVYAGGKLHHYAGVFGGWELYKSTEMDEAKCEEHIKNWFDEV